MATKKKNVVSKDDLKRLMKQSSLQTANRKIDSPLAKYDSLGNLYCALCSTKVKNNLHWKAHVQGRTHKENLDDLKQQQIRKQEATVAPPVELTRKRNASPTPNNDHGHSKSKKSKLPGDFFDNNQSTKSTVKKSTHQNSQSNSILGANYSQSSSEEESDEDNRTSLNDVTKTQPLTSGSGVVTDKVSGLPADFFDSGVIPSTSTSNEENKETEEDEDAKAKSMADKLPEGFFDDPKADAKAREIKYIDKDEEEWELFQKAIKEENIISEQLQEEDDDEKQTERNVKEIDEHIYHWSKVEELHEKKDKVLTAERTKDASSDLSDSDLDEKEYEELLDWRTKQM